MSPVHRAARSAQLVASVLLLCVLCACGIPTTGVVGSGEPATGVQSTTTVYFTGKLGRVIAVPRRTPQRTGVEAAVKLLFQGPSTSEQLAGAFTALPRLKKDPVVRTDGAKVSIELVFDTRPEFARGFTSLDRDDALEQLACTAAGARHAEDPDVESVEVVVVITMTGVERHWITKGDSATCAKSVRIPATTSQPG